MDQGKPSELYGFFEKVRMMLSMLPAMLGRRGDG
jgi:hypothetical protein